MPFFFTVKKTVTTVASDGNIRLFHGTLPEHVTSLVSGIDFEKCGGEFWVSPDPDSAWHFAGVAEQQRLFTSGPTGQALVSFDLPLSVAESFLGHEPDPWLMQYTHGWKFFSACAPDLNRSIQDIEIVFEQ
jgi:hypothetical protein